MCLLWMANNLLTVSHCRNFWLFIPESNFGRLLLPSMLFGRSASFLIFFHLLLLFRMLVFFSSHTFPLFGTLAQSFCRFSIFVYMYWNRIEESNNTKKKTNIVRSCFETTNTNAFYTTARERATWSYFGCIISHATKSVIQRVKSLSRCVPMAWLASHSACTSVFSVMAIPTARTIDDDDDGIKNHQQQQRFNIFYSSCNHPLFENHSSF